MIIVSTFQHSIELEQALSRLETIGITSDQLLVVCMDSDSSDSDQPKAEEWNSKGVEIGIACATALSVIGTSLGFILPWGPVFCGLIAAFLGFGFGYGIHSFFLRPIRRHLKEKPQEVTVIVQCNPDQSAYVQKVMWMNHARTVGIANASAE